MPSKRIKYHSAKLRSPTSPRDWRAYVRAPAGSPCPKGTHRAPYYDKYKPSKNYCTRDCAAWSPAGTKKQGKKGRCFTPTGRPLKQNAWQAVLADVRQVAAPMLAGLEGVEKRNAMKELMVEAGEVYSRILGKGATMAQYRAKREEIMQAIA